MKKKRNFIPYILITIALVGAVLYFLFRTEYSEYKRFNSPDGKYTLVVYIDSTPDYLPVPLTHSEVSNSKAYVALIDKKNYKILAKSNIFNDCYFILDNLYVKWDMKNNKVFFTSRGAYINLQSMKMMDCFLCL